MQRQTRTRKNKLIPSDDNDDHADDDDSLIRFDQHVWQLAEQSLHVGLSFRKPLVTFCLYKVSEGMTTCKSSRDR